MINLVIEKHWENIQDDIAQIGLPFRTTCDMYVLDFVFDEMICENMSRIFSISNPYAVNASHNKTSHYSNTNYE